jgi:hypothetical protein
LFSLWSFEAVISKVYARCPGRKMNTRMHYNIIQFICSELEKHEMRAPLNCKVLLMQNYKDSILVQCGYNLGSIRLADSKEILGCGLRKYSRKFELISEYTYNTKL